MKINDFLNEKNIIIANANETKEEIIEKLIDLLYQSGLVTDRQTCLKDVLTREKIQSTGLEKGIAIPHSKTKTVTETTSALYINPAGIDFNSFDGEPTKVVFLLLAPPAQTGKRLKALGTIAHLIDNLEIIDTITNCTSNHEVIEILQKIP